MQAKVIKKIIIELTMDSSEVIMFTKGGKHKTRLFLNEIIEGEHIHDNDFSCCTSSGEVEITVQMDPEEKSRYNHITDEAHKHRTREYEERKKNEENWKVKILNGSQPLEFAGLSQEEIRMLNNLPKMSDINESKPT